MRGETQRVAARVRELLDQDACGHRVPDGDAGAEVSAGGQARDCAPAGDPDEGREPGREVGRDGISGYDLAGSSTAVRRHAAARRGDRPRPVSAAAMWWRHLAARMSCGGSVRIDPGRRAAAGVGVAVLVAALLVGGWLWMSRPRTADVPAPTPVADARTPSGTTAPAGSAESPAAGSAASSASVVPAPGSSTAQQVVVDVAGKVARPGVYRLPTGSRVADAVAAAGGARHGVDLTDINLAAVLADGQQIVVGLPAGAGSAQPAGTGSVAASASGGAAGPIDLNTATLDQLETLPGIGPALGQRIIDYRTQNGPFTSVDQLNDVSGIGEVKFAAVKDLVTV